MTPGEESIYEFILEKNAHYALKTIKAEVTRRILHQYAEKETERIKAEEERVKLLVMKEFGNSPLINKYGGYGMGMFFGIYNDIGNGIQYECCNQGLWFPDPMNGKFMPLPYGKIEKDLGISKGVAKPCLERLIDRGKLTRKRGIGGYEYSPEHEDLIKRMVEAPGKWEPQTFDPECGYRTGDTLYPLIEDAQKGMQPFQEYYEQVVKEVCDKPCP